MYYYQYWRHKPTGDIYAVRVDDGGNLNGIHGPLPVARVFTANLNHLQYWPTYRLGIVTGDYALHDIEPYEDAQRRIAATPALAAHREAIMAGGRRDDTAYWEWVATAPAADVADRG